MWFPVWEASTKKNCFRYSPALSWLRYGVLALFVAVCGAGLWAGVTGLMGWAGLLEPYSAYGRMASNLLAPFYRWGNNLLAYMAERMDSYAFYEAEVWMKGLSVLGVALLTFVVLSVLAWRNGRTYCNTICPVGTLLGFLSRYAWLKPVVDTSKCVNCNLCERNCKASCIQGDLDGGKRPERPGFASTSGRKRGKMHRLRSL